VSKPKTQPQLLEADIRRTVVEFMVLHGWRHFRTDPVSDRRRATGFGEKGMPDDLFLRYWSWVNGHPAAIVWIEFKRPGQEPKPHQLAWHQAERARGGSVLVVDDIDAFIKAYPGNVE
jgi:hypothetical protein